jgi:hypothetical protein
MTTLCSSPEFDVWPADDNNSLVEGGGRSSSHNTTTTPSNKENISKPVNPRKFCNLWKSKRKQAKKALLEMRREESILFDHELASETKQNAQEIQRRFEKRFDEKDYSQRYEKYGSRANFIRDRNL